MPSVPAIVRGLPATLLLCTLLVAHSDVWRRAVCEAHFHLPSQVRANRVRLLASKRPRARLRNRPQRRPVPR